MSSSTNTADGFQHEPLADPKTHIRLLKITEGRLGQRVTCTLTTWPLKEAPPYTAISYTWGDPENTSTIFIDGKPKVVRRNCEYILHQAWGVDTESLYWVDALCIDQSLTEEKNHQVAMMGDLYKRATRVLACIGEHSGDSKFLMRILKTYKAYLTRRKGAAFLNGYESSNDWIGQSFALQKNSGSKDLRIRTRLYTYRGKITRVFCETLQRSYFSRVWVLQELYLGNGRITVCCGMDHQPLANLYVLGLLIEQWVAWPGRKELSYLDRLPVCIVSIAHSLHMIIPIEEKHLYSLQGAQKGSLAAGAGDLKRPTRLPWLFPSMAKLDCEDPRDRIYGVRSLVDWEGQAAPFPDYSKDVFSLAVEVMDIIHTQLRRQFTERHEWTEQSMLSLAGHLRSMLRFSLESILLQDAIRKRRPGLTHQYRVRKSYTNRKQGEFLWCGETLGKNFKLDTCDTHVQIRNQQNEIIALGPKDTWLGDWFLTTNHQAHRPSSIAFWEYKHYAKQHPLKPSLIIRVAQTGVCSIIGPTFNPIFSCKLVKLQNPKFFVCWWDPEDILVLEWRYSQYDKHEEVAEQIDNCFGLRATVSPDSTMVKGPFEPQEIQAEISKGAERMFLESDYKDWRK